MTVENYSGGEARVKESTGADGGRSVRVITDTVKAKLQSDVVRGGSFSSTMRQTFGLGRVMARRG